MDKNFYNLVLASQSPRRKELLGSLFIPFKTIPADINENLKIADPVKLVEELAFQKAKKVFDQMTLPSIVIGSDTVVVLNGEVLGKPVDRKDARSMLVSLSGKTHQVYTGVSLIKSEKEHQTFHIGTKVKFREIPDDLLELYLDTEESMDKAGSYGIQSYALSFIEGIEGSYSNVVGLPVDTLLIELTKLVGAGENWREVFRS